MFWTLKKKKLDKETVVIDLAQDSDYDNSKVRRSKFPADADFQDVKEWFRGPF